MTFHIALRQPGDAHRTCVERFRARVAPVDGPLWPMLHSIVRSRLYLLRVIFVVYLSGGNSIRNKAKGLIRPRMILWYLLREHVGISPHMDMPDLRSDRTQ